MIRCLCVLVAALALGGCATTTYYYEDLGGADYYYGDSYYDSAGYAGGSYYIGPVAVVGSSCSYYTWYGATSCYAPAWAWASPYSVGGWAGWGWPGVSLGWHGNYWYGSLSFGFGTHGIWGYPGFYNPWFGPWWPYSWTYPSYPADPKPVRNRRDLYASRVAQASWRSGAAAGAAAGIAGTNRFRPGARQPHGNRPAAARNGTMPRGRPDRGGIPADWVPPRRADAARPSTRPSRSIQPIRRQSRTEPRPHRIERPSAGMKSSARTQPVVEPHVRPVRRQASPAPRMPRNRRPVRSQRPSVTQPRPRSTPAPRHRPSPARSRPATSPRRAAPARSAPVRSAPVRSSSNSKRRRLKTSSED